MFLCSLLALLPLIVLGDIHAVLIAGSRGYWNYRHQSDVFHAYHILIDHGVKADNIITLAYDDIAYHPENPYKGRIFNCPNGPNVYEGVPIDYRGRDVTTHNYKAILRGDAKAIRGGNGRVLQSGKDDHVFLFYSDHGAPGIVSVIDDFLSVKELHETFNQMRVDEKFSKLVMYLESCESGSMFHNRLNRDSKIFAVSASNPRQSSWAWYCGDRKISTCLGDLFSISWMEHSDEVDLNAETLEEQFNIAKKRTTLSEVLNYGDQSFLFETIGKFQGLSNTTKRRAENSANNIGWDSRDVPLKTFISLSENTKDSFKKEAYTKRISEIKALRHYHDLHTEALIRSLRPNDFSSIMDEIPIEIINTDCHHQVTRAYHELCFNLGQHEYALRAVSPLTTLCNQGIPADHIIQTLHQHCPLPFSQYSEHCII